MFRTNLDLQRICFPAEDKHYADAAGVPRVVEYPRVASTEVPPELGLPVIPPRRDTGDIPSPAVIDDVAGYGACPVAFDELIGECWGMRRLYDQLIRIAATDSTVLVVGETGTGKELVARSIHRRSLRRHKPLVAYNCAAVSESLLESELFGHMKGAFTDARTDRKGLFLQADGGTLLLDEIGEMPLTMQAKLLRALEERAVRPVGGEREIKVDVRLIALTHCDLELAVEQGRFRQDLLFRINVIPLKLPALRERDRDAVQLARHFLNQFADRFGKPVRDLTPAAEEKLCRYRWPGNVRELRNVIERAVALTSQTKLSSDDIPDNVRNQSEQPDFVPTNDPTSLITLKEVERRYIRHVLRTVGGNKAFAARVLGIGRETLSRYFRRGSDDD